MKPAPFTYHRPRSADEAVELLAELGEDAKVIAGGQSLLPVMNMRLAAPEHLVDISHVEELRSWVESPDDIRYGAAVTHGMIEDGWAPDACRGLLQRAAAGIGYRAIRNRGTLGGSLAHADSSAEWPTVMAAADAQIGLRSTRGARTLSARSFFHGFFSTAMESDELLVSCTVPRLADEVNWSLAKTNRKAGEFAESLAVVIVGLEGDLVTDPHVWLGAARDIPLGLGHVERGLTGRRPREVSLEEVRGWVLDDLESGWDDLPVASRHALQQHSVTVHRALTTIERRNVHV